MYIEEFRRAVMASTRERLAEIQTALWKSHAAGAIGDDDAQALAELIAAKRAIPAPARAARRHVGSRPRAAASIERRRSWTASGWLPPPLASQFTPGELAALAVVAAEVALRGHCELPIGAIAGRAGVCASTARNAIRQARTLGMVAVEERRLSYARNLPNVVRITSPQWTSWITIRGRGLARGGRVQIRAAHENSIIFSLGSPLQTASLEGNSIREWRRGRRG